MKPTSKFLFWSLMLASATVRPLAAQEPTHLFRVEPAAAEAEAPQAGDGGEGQAGKSAATRPIERQVLLTQMRAAYQAIAEAAQQADEQTGPDAEPFRKTMSKYAAWLGTLQGDFTALGTVPANEGAEAQEVAEGLNMTAWELLTESEAPAQHAAVALKVTDTMVAVMKAGGGKVPAHMLDTRARAFFLSGNQDAAVKQQQEAVKAAEGSEKDELKITLEAYRRGQMPKAAEEKEAPEPENDAIAKAVAKANAAIAAVEVAKAEVEAAAASKKASMHRAREVERLIAMPRRAPTAAVPAGEDKFNTAETAFSINEIAWELLTHPDTNKRRPDLALPLAEVAEKLAAEGHPDLKDAALMDTRARALFQLNRKDEAIKLQKEALAASGEEGGLKEELTATLAAYEKGESPAAREEDQSPAPAAAKANQLNSVAWALVGRSWKPEETLKIADAALVLAGNKEIRKEILDTRARAAFQAGLKEDAIATEKQAIAACGAADAGLKKTFEAALASFEKGEAPRMTQASSSVAQVAPVAPTTEAPRAYSDEEAMEANENAWNLLTDDAPTKEQGTQALALIAPAVAGVAKDYNMRAAMLDTKARALFVLGKKAEAITTEKEALDNCGEDDSQKEIFESTLESYEKGTLPAAQN